MEIKISNATIMWQHLHRIIVNGLVENFHFFLFFSPHVLVALDLVVTPKGSSTMVLRLGMGCMGLCSTCLGRRNLKEREGVLMKNCK
jgi:hypothetical protein